MRLIPKSQSSLLSRQELDKDHHLAVWVDKEIRLKDEDGKLNPAAIQIKRIPGFSTNKVPPSKKWYLNIQFHSAFTNLYRTLWNEGEPGVYPEKNHFTFNRKRNCYYLKIADMDQYKDLYQYPANSENNFEFELGIIHQPLIANYWHFEFEVNSQHGKVEKGDKGWQKLVCSMVRDRVQDKAKFSI
jgi:hypothetical protein